MKVLIYLHHPAHFHLFKNIIDNISKHNEVLILATKKDILENLLLLKGYKYINMLPKGRKNNKFSIAFGLLKQDLKLLNICLKQKPDLLVGTSTEIAHIGKLLNIPSIFTNEDDIKAVPLIGILAYPFAKHLFVPYVCDVGKWESKTIKYNSYHELAYLHPKNFTPSIEVVKKYITIKEKYFILRFSDLSAHHDKNKKGISNELAIRLIHILKKYGRVFITSERKLDKIFEKYRININPLDMHHFLYYSSLLIGDSQTMSAEAGVLGVPFIRYNDFVGKISYLNELENIYKLGYGINTSNEDYMISIVKKIISKNDIKKLYINRRDKMLKDKIDYSSFLSWVINNYPNSIKVIKENQDYQYNFK